MLELQPVDAVEVTLVVDNYVDILAAGTEGVRRFPLAYDFDGGMTPRGLANNLDVMGIDRLPHPPGQPGDIFEPIIEPTVAAFASVGTVLRF